MQMSEAVEMEEPVERQEAEERQEPQRPRSSSRWKDVIVKLDAVKTFKKEGQAAKARRELGTFFGVTREADPREDEKWNQRRLRMIARKFGNLNCENLAHAAATPVEGDVHDGVPPTLQRGISRCLRQPSRGVCGASFVEKTNAFSTLHAGIKWKLQAAKAKKEEKEEDVVDRGIQEEDAEVAETALTTNRAPHVNFYPKDQEDRAGDSLLTDNALGQPLHPKDLLKAAATPKRKPFKLRLGVFGKTFGCLPKRDRATTEILKEMDKMPEYRPYFTYWITFVQVVVLLIAVIGYGFAPIGLKVVTKSEKELLRPNVALEKVCWMEYDNMWIGPRQADLIRLGARYSPCMRYDKNLHDSIILPDREAEKNSACCVRNDGSGCYQTKKAQCSQTLSEWLKWPEGQGSVARDGINRTSGSVCGLDPRFCINPGSVKPFVWPDDITRWPLCRSKKDVTTISTSSSKHSLYRHMTCEITGRPCCVGIKGECVITSREHCDFMRGYYHQNASLCSQVNCLNEICGLLPFFFSGDGDSPDQFYRLFLSMFLHAGILHLLLSLFIQLIFMSDLEMMSGWHRISIIYILSGFMGNLMSAIFLPYQVEAGPTGCHFGLLAMTLVEFHNAWRFIKNPRRALLKYTVFSILALAIGLLPWVDNYSHIAGFFSGLFLSYILLPYVSIGGDNFKMRIISIIIFSLLWIGIAVTLMLFFYLWPIVKCPACKYLNCVPLTPNFCDNMGVNVTKRSPCLM